MIHWRQLYKNMFGSKILSSSNPKSENRNLWSKVLQLIRGSNSIILHVKKSQEICAEGFYVGRISVQALSSNFQHLNNARSIRA